MAKPEARIAAPEIPTRILFARVGWMTYYAGPQDGDERPTGGGRYNKKNVGHELFNFAEFGGRLYGYVAASVNLKRIDPIAGAVEKIDDVLVIFVARQHIVGWYRDATLYASIQHKFPASVAKEMLRRLKQSGTRGFSLSGFRFEATVENATPLPTYERTQETPVNVRGGFGRSNTRYLLRTSGKTQIYKWMEDAIRYVANYDRANLLDDPSAEMNPEEAVSQALERAAGFQSDPTIRKSIEKHAMKKAQKALEQRGFSRFEDTSATKPYDFTCSRKAKKFFVEVKGTQMRGKSVVLTKNEVQHVTSNPENCVLVVVHSVKLNWKKTATAGITDVTKKWVLTDGELTATQYLWKR